MRISIKILALFLLFFTSCNDWLNVRPEGEATEGQLFEKGEGFRSLLNGVYQSMGYYNLYGGELQYGILDCMSQQYKVSLLNNGMTGTEGFEKYIAAGKLDYTEVHLSSAIDQIWASAFNVIADANCLIQNAEIASPDIFSKGEVERKMILGEAYACRALMHFDLLRLFAPALENDDNQVYVPYVETFPDVLAVRIGVKPFLDKVIADLQHAQTLVMEFDTSAIGRSVSACGEARFQNLIRSDMAGGAQDNTPIESFFKGRGYRLSYYAISAVLARVYQYAGLHKEAFDEAQKVLAFKVKGRQNTYPLFSIDNYSGIASYSDVNSKTDLKVMSNLIFAVYNAKMYDISMFKSFFTLKSSIEKSVTWLVSNHVSQNVFYNGAINEFDQDYRGKLSFFKGDNDEKYPVSIKWYINENKTIRDANITILPVIRATEMRYIMAEYYARNNNFAEAQNILNEIRTNRKCTAPVDVKDWDSFVKALVGDARREWIAEGQLFYLYKRLNADVNFENGAVRPLKRSEYLLPIPTNQTL